MLLVYVLNRNLFFLFSYNYLSQSYHYRLVFELPSWKKSSLLSSKLITAVDGFQYRCSHGSTEYETTRLEDLSFSFFFF